MPPLRSTRYVHYTIRSRAGHAPPLRDGGFCILQYPQVFPSSVTCGDSFPQWGKPFARFTRWVALAGWLQRAAYMPPLRTDPLYSLHYTVVGGACPAPTLPIYIIKPATTAKQQGGVKTPPYDTSRNVVAITNPRAGHTPPLPIIIGASLTIPFEFTTDSYLYFVQL